MLMHPTERAKNINSKYLFFNNTNIPQTVKYTTHPNFQSNYSKYSFLLGFFKL